MFKQAQDYILSAGDLTAHLACAHRTNLDRAVADGVEQSPPVYKDAMLEALMERGRRHEAAYVQRLRDQGLNVVSIDAVGVSDAAVAATLAAMGDGVDVIVQGALRHGPWTGRPDILQRIDRPSPLGSWSYQVKDTKLARETTGATVLQLCLYSDLLGHTQGLAPEFAFAVTPAESGALEEAYRVAAYSAFYRRVRRALESSLEQQPLATYPEPVGACDICRWFQICDAKRRSDDHPSFVAGLSRTHIAELRDHNLTTLTAFATAAAPLPWKPKRGARETYAALQRQAKIQLDGKRSGTPTYELISYREGLGLARLPAPSKGDIFLDFEGDAYVGASGLEYLLGYVCEDETGAPVYRGLWARNPVEEKQAFEAFIDFVLERQKLYPDLHIYHYAPYEPSALKRLMGRYVTREDELDALLRSECFVDLLSVVRNGVRASVESYSIKKLEDFYGYKRKAALTDANRALTRVQAALELGVTLADLAEDCEVVERYNEDDCRSTLALRDWLETLRLELIAGGAPDARPAPKSTEASEKVTQRAARERALVDALTAGLPVDPEARSEAESAHWLLAQLVGWHRREDKSSFHENYRLQALSPEELMDERCALAGLQFEAEIEPGPTPVHRYRFPPQETELREGDSVKAAGGGSFGSVRAISAAEHWIDIKKQKATAQTHVAAIYEFEHVDSESVAKAISRIGEHVATHGLDDAYAPARDLLLRRPPQPSSGVVRQASEALDATAVRIIGDMSEGVLPIQGPPGAGKTFTGARMIASLVAAGKKVGVTATSHKVVLHLLEEAAKAAISQGAKIRCVHKGNKDLTSPHPDIVIDTTSSKGANKKVLDRLGVDADVIGGTAWLWADADARDGVDVLFVDEAAQMSLANVIAVSQAAKSLVLLGDPRQLEQPSKGSHPDGADASALDHILGGAKTIGASQGLFLAETWRLHPKICDFTSELFYEERLEPRTGLEVQRVTTSGRLNGAGLRYLPVAHSGNQNSSIEEVAAISALVNETLAGSPTWIDRDGDEHPLDLEHILIVAPYNSQVFALRELMPNARIGTVDKFQGQEAPIVIYSMASSSSADAPRGMEFLYSLNRLNVATSRAKAICVLVASPALFEAECRTPRQMELANALCRYKELAEEI